MEQRKLKMTPKQKIRREVISQALEENDEKYEEFKGVEVTEDNVDDVFEDMEGMHWTTGDILYEMRNGEVETDISCGFSRHYESQSVAMKCCDDTWIGWTYWYGGGKHGEPEAIPWMEEAYELDCVETQEVVTTRKFSKK
jgi:hypothetical protein